MSFPKSITIGGRTYLWRDLVAVRREQRKQARQALPVLFELKEDRRPPAERTAGDRYQEPSLFGESL